MRTSLTTDITSVHTMSHPEINVTGDTATGSWAMSDVVIVPGHNVLITGTSYYTDRYRRDSDGSWRISHICTTASTRLCRTPRTSVSI